MRKSMRVNSSLHTFQSTRDQSTIRDFFFKTITSIATEVISIPFSQGLMGVVYLTRYGPFFGGEKSTISINILAFSMFAEPKPLP